MCDMNLPGQTEGEIDVDGSMEPVQDYVAVVGFAEGHPDQPCSADMWRFSISEARWQRAEIEPSSASGDNEQSIWPAARCGASVIANLGSILDPPNLTVASQKSLPQQLLPPSKAAPWIEKAQSAPPATSTAEAQTAVFAIVGGWGGYSGGECEEWPSCDANPRSACTFKSYLSEALDNAAARSARHRAAGCVEMSDAWQLSVAMDSNK